MVTVAWSSQNIAADEQLLRWKKVIWNVANVLLLCYRSSWVPAILCHWHKSSNV